MLRTVSVAADSSFPHCPFLTFQKDMTAEWLRCIFIHCTYTFMHPMASCAPCEHALSLHACLTLTLHVSPEAQSTFKFAAVMFPDMPFSV